jgi:ATP-dependent Clp protease adaptor protein ClpS
VLRYPWKLVPMVTKSLSGGLWGRWRRLAAPYIMGLPESGGLNHTRLGTLGSWKNTWKRDAVTAFFDNMAGQAPFRMAKGDDDRRAGRDDGTGTAVITRTKPQTKRPNLYRVLILNDDYTPMEFVVHVLERYFNKQREDATRIMLHVHQNGVGECGIFTYEVAETKVTQVMDFARKHQHPLQCVMEKK